MQSVIAWWRKCEPRDFVSDMTGDEPSILYGIQGEISSGNETISPSIHFQDRAVTVKAQLSLNRLLKLVARDVTQICS